MNGRRPFVIAAALLALSTTPSIAAKTAFRITALYLRDPHVLVDLGGECTDITDVAFPFFSFNEMLNVRTQNDNDGDGKFDNSDVLVFDPLDQTAGAGELPAQLVHGTHLCSVPQWMTACWLDSTPFLSPVTYYNLADCSGFIEPGSIVHSYTPVITLPAAPCFSALLSNFYLNLNGVPIGLFNVTISATYVGNPATGIVNGLMRGFLSAGQANNTIIPGGMFFEDDQPVSKLFPGGAGNCAAWSDMDGLGWYVYLNFTAVKVTYVANDSPVGIGDTAPALTLEAPHPNPFNPSTEIRYVLPRATRVQIAIYDASGRLVSELANEEQVKGDHGMHWDGRNARGATVGSGVYFVRLTADGEVRTQKMVLLK